MAILEALNLKECESLIPLSPDALGYSDIASWDKTWYGSEEDAASQYASLVEQYGEPHYVDGGGCCHWYREGTPPKKPMIPHHAFNEKISLYNIELPEYIECIEERAFNFSNISGTLVIPDDVVEIGDYAFQGCSMLTGLKTSEDR